MRFLEDSVVVASEPGRGGGSWDGGGAPGVSHRQDPGRGQAAGAPAWLGAVRARLQAHSAAPHPATQNPSRPVSPCGCRALTMSPVGRREEAQAQLRAVGPVYRRKTAWGVGGGKRGFRPCLSGLCLPPPPFKEASGEQSWCPGTREEPEEAGVGRAEVGPLPLNVSSGGRASGPHLQAISGSP